MKPILQINVWMPNVPGNLANVCDRLRAANVNITALSCTEGAATTMIHLIVDDAETAKIVLQPHYKVSASEVFAFIVKDKPGSIASIARACAAAGVNIRTIYGTASGKEGLVYVSVDDTAKAMAAFGSWKDGSVKLIA